MKSQKGMTLMSVVIYIIVLTTVVGMLSTMTKYFYRNTEETIITSDTANQHTRFIAYITNDINSRENRKCNYK